MSSRPALNAVTSAFGVPDRSKKGSTSVALSFRARSGCYASSNSAGYLCLPNGLISDGTTSPPSFRWELTIR